MQVQHDKMASVEPDLEKTEMVGSRGVRMRNRDGIAIFFFQGRRNRTATSRLSSTAMLAMLLALMVLSGCGSAASASGSASDANAASSDGGRAAVAQSSDGSGQNASDTGRTDVASQQTGSSITQATQTPSPHPSPSPTPSPSPSPEPAVFTLVSAGDVVPHKTFQDSALTADGKTYDYRPTFAGVKSYVESADLAVIDMESALVEKTGDYTGYPCFNTHPVFFDAMRDTGFDLLNNVNNHALDRRLKGAFQTRENAENAGLDVFGVVNRGEVRFKIRESGGIRVAMASYTYSYNGNEGALTAQERSDSLSLLDEARMKSELEAMEKEADISVVLLHWGNEYQQTPSRAQRDLAAKLLSWGADVLLGSHPHVVQPSEIVEVDGKTKYVVYSMGNFASNQRRGTGGMPNEHKELCEDSMLVDLTFARDPATGETTIQSVRHVPTWLWKYDENGAPRYRVIPVPSESDPSLDALPAAVAAEARASYERTMPMMTNYP